MKKRERETIRRIVVELRMGLIDRPHDRRIIEASQGLEELVGDREPPPHLFKWRRAQ